MATVKKYNQMVTVNVQGAAAVSEGLLYGIDSSGKAVVADQTTGPQGAYGFAVKGLTTAQVANNEVCALCTLGIIECAAADIAGGAFTAGANVYLGTGGGYTSTKPTTNAHLAQFIGIALSTTKVAVSVGRPDLTAQTAGNSNIGI